MTTTYSNIAPSVVEQFRSEGMSELEIEELNAECVKDERFISFACRLPEEQEPEKPQAAAA
jgi:hypothetical protein